MSVYEVTVKLDGCHPKHTTYPLLPEDILVAKPDGTFQKTAVGLCIGGFILTEEQRATLKLLEKHPPIEIVGMSEFIGGSS